MTKRDMANLLLKAFSIYSFLMALQNAPYLINDLVLLQEQTFPKVMQISIPTFTMLLAGILLWVVSGRGAKLILGYENNEASDVVVHASLHDIQVLAFSLCGLYLLSKAVPDLIQNTLIIIWVSFQGSKIENMAPHMLYSIIYVCIGIWLLFGAKGIVVFIKKLRRAGQFKSSHSSAE
jgi:hypothetical protein